MYVLDSSAIIAGIKPPPHEVIVPPSVLHEIKNLPPDIGLYYVIEPDREFIEEVVKIAKRTGDYEVLSPVDIDVIALALQENATIITDDYAIQNVAAHLGLKFESGEMRGIREKRKWKWRCESCGRYYSKFHETCPVCGGRLRRVRSR